MAMKVTKAQVWAGAIQDRPGGLAATLDPLADAGANLEFVLARRASERPGEGVVFLTPLKGKKAQNAASAAGMNLTQSVPTLRVEGANKAGAGRAITRALGDAGISMRGLSAAAIGTRFVAYISFDSADDADRAAKALRKVK